MINPLPWRLDEGDPSIIYSADGDIVAEDYTFKNMDDFEALCEMVNFAKGKTPRARGTHER